MKKIFKVFTKPKKRTDNFQNIHEDYANDTSKTFGYFQFDANISKIDKKTFSETPETYNTRETEQYAKDLDHIRASLTLSETVGCNNTSLVTNTSQTTAQDKYKCSRTQRKVTDKKFHTTSGYNDTIPESKIEKSQQENKMKTSVHIININNCKYFHIGPKTTIDVRTSGKEIHKLLGADELCSPDDLENLLDNEEKLSECHLKTIAFNYKDEWKQFAIYLGLPQDFIHDTDRRFEDKSFKIYHVLQEYLKQFPNTSIGFIVHILMNCSQVNVINKLFQHIHKK